MEDRNRIQYLNQMEEILKKEMGSKIKRFK